VTLKLFVVGSDPAACGRLGWAKTYDAEYVGLARLLRFRESLCDSGRVHNFRLRFRFRLLAKSERLPCLAESGLPVGIYSSASMWSAITGGMY
jgi:hypothetical protein